jgi:hypothetical protein
MNAALKVTALNVSIAVIRLPASLIPATKHYCFRVLIFREQLRQLGEVGGDAPGFRSARANWPRARFILEIDVRQLMWPRKFTTKQGCVPLTDHGGERRSANCAAFQLLGKR